MFDRGSRALESGVLHKQLHSINIMIWKRYEVDPIPTEEWASQTIRILVDHSQTLWEMRNEILFPQHTDPNITKHELLEKIKEEYCNSRTLVHPNDKFLFRKPISLWSQSSNTIKRKWLETFSVAKQAYQIFLHSHDPSQLGITTFFTKL